jgi:signal transduction histidine kinase
MATQKGIALETTIPDGAFVYADENMLSAVIRNLTSNALKFTPSGGQVSISACPVGEANTLVEISVSDTGVGISAEDQAKLFKLGQTHTTLGTAKEQGSGLGLIICQEMVEKNGGQIWIESDGVPGRGTSVKFTVPMAQGVVIVWDKPQPHRIIPKLLTQTGFVHCVICRMKMAALL